MKQVCAKMRNTWSGLEEVTWPKSGRVRLVVMISMPDFVAGWDNLLFIAANDTKSLSWSNYGYCSIYIKHEEHPIEHFTISDSIDVFELYIIRGSTDFEDLKTLKRWVGKPCAVPFPIDLIGKAINVPVVSFSRPILLQFVLRR